jgi:NADPH2:quinone reductase
MKAMVIRNFGSHDVFEIADIDKPTQEAGDILIKVASSSVNPVDTKIRSGVVAAVAPDFPGVLHGDVAGVVEDVGEGVTSFKPGDEVYACAGGIKGLGGALAEYMLADADLVAPKPKNLSMTEAGVLPLVTITAWNAIVDRANVRSGQKVLVHGGTGGVGHIGVQLAKQVGAEVYTTVSSEEKETAAKELGADHVIRYKDTSVVDYVKEHTGGKGFDVVFDTVGTDTMDRSFEAAADNGTVVTIAARSTHDLSPLHGKGLTLHVVFMLLPLLRGRARATHGEILRKAAILIEDGKLRPLVDQETFSFENVGKAHARLEAGEAMGKIALVNEW